jgi:PleD family two-component response regulator
MYTADATFLIWSCRQMPWPFKKKEKLGFDPKDKTILVVDDESDIRTIVETLLAGHGYKVVQAKDGAEALMLLRKRKFT